MTKEEAKAIYANKKFFRIDPMGNLKGPFNNIFYVATYPLPTEDGYMYVQCPAGKKPFFLRPDEVFVKEG